MKININQNFWNKSNIVAKVFLMIGFFFVDLGMKLNGLEQSDENNN